MLTMNLNAVDGEGERAEGQLSCVCEYCEKAVQNVPTYIYFIPKCMGERGWGVLGWVVGPKSKCCWHRAGRRPNCNEMRSQTICIRWATTKVENV